MRRSLLALAVGVLAAVPALSGADPGRSSAEGRRPCACAAASSAPGSTKAEAPDPNFWANHFQTSVEAPR